MIFRMVDVGVDVFLRHEGSDDCNGLSCVPKKGTEIASNGFY